VTEQQKFDQVMKKILSVSKQDLQRRLEEEKKEKIAATELKYQAR
jgi:hypothetical protein